MSRELMTWSLRSLSSSSQNMWVRSMSTKLNKLLLFFLICGLFVFPKSAASGHILPKKEVVALEYTVEPVLTATAAWNLSPEMVTDLI